MGNADQNRTMKRCKTKTPRGNVWGGGSESGSYWVPNRRTVTWQASICYQTLTYDVDDHSRATARKKGLLLFKKIEHGKISKRGGPQMQVLHCHLDALFHLTLIKGAKEYNIGPETAPGAVPKVSPDATRGDD